MELVTPSIGLIFWQLVIFLIVLFLLKKFAWAPILDAVKEREQGIAEALNAAQKAQAETQNIAAESQKLLTQARAERDTMLAEAKDAKNAIIAEAKLQADTEGKRIITNAKEAINTEKMAAMTEVKNLVGNLSIEIAEKLLQKQFDNRNEQESLVQKHLQDIKLN